MNETLDKLTIQIEKLFKERENYENIEKIYKIQLESKDKEINDLQEKVYELNENIKKLKNNNILKEKQKRNEAIENKNEELYTISFPSKKSKIILFQEDNKEKKISFNKSNLSSNNNINNFLKNNSKRLLGKNHSLSAINIHNNNQFPYFDKERLISKEDDDKSNIITDNMSTYIYNQNNSNILIKENSYNIKKNIQFNNQIRLILPFNTTNTNLSEKVINSNSNVLTDNINYEKMKIQQKLVEYRKLIDDKINELMIKKINNRNKTYSSENKRHFPPKKIDYDSSNKKGIFFINSDHQRQRQSEKKSKKLIINFKYKKDFFKNMYNKHKFIPKLKEDCDRNNQNISEMNIRINNKSKKILSLKNKLNIINKINIRNEKRSSSLIDNEITDNNNYEHIKTKRNEDNKK